MLFAAVDNVPAGFIVIADRLKDSARSLIRQLKQAGVRIVMVTGDAEGAAHAIAREAGIEEVRAGVAPDKKAEIVKDFQSRGHRVAMAGDGVNDAVALAQADVGIAMGTGAEAAMESAGLTLLRGDLRGILRARTLSRATLRNIRQNLAFAFLYNILGIPIAAGALYPIWGILLSPIIAGAAMSFSSVCVIANALRLKRQKI